MKTRRILITILLAVSLALLCSCTQLSGLFGPQAQACTVHKDLNRDNVCDTCGKAIPVNCTNHTDTDHDGKCDTNGCTVELAVFHTDANHDGICDAENCAFSLDVVHSDANADGKCDVCSAALEKESCDECVDSNGDGKCDVCGGEVNPPEKEPCTECVDANADGKCDVCGAEVEKEVCEVCVDENKDKVCDVCNSEIVLEETVLIENSVAKFVFVMPDGVPGTVVREVDNLIKKLKGFGITATKVDDTADSIQDCEILIGDITTRGEQYRFNRYDYGMKGYAIRVIDGKVVIVGGSDDILPAAIAAFKEEILGITDATKKLTNVKVTSYDDVIEIQDDYKIGAITLFGEDIKGYTIAVDKNASAAYTAALDLQNLLYVKAGYWLPIVTLGESDKSIEIVLADKTGGDGLYVTFSEGKMEFVCEYTTAIKTEITDFFSRKIVISEGADLEFTADDSYVKNVRDVYYEDFGAKGDGKTDDLLAIIAAHNYANEGGHPVFATPGRTYYIGNNNGENHFSGAKIMTDTTWSGAFFIIDDSKIGTEDLRGSTYARQVPIFKAVPSVSTITKSAALAGVTSISNDATNIGFAPGYPALVLIVNTNQKNFIREGVNADAGQNEKEVVLVDAQGNIDPSTPLMWNYETVTSFTIYHINEEPITIQGGHFTTIYNQAPCVYRPYERGIFVARSNVTVKNITHENTGEGETGAPSGGFTKFEGANNVLFENITYDNMKSFYDQTSGAVMGSYEISGHYCTNLVWRNCVQSDFWRTDTIEPETYAKSGGIMGSSFNKDLYFYNCILSSFDAHCGVQDVTIVDSQFEHINCIGGGKAYFENVTIHAMYQKNAIMLRGDYGSIWMGDFYFINCTLVTEDAHEIALFDASWANHDFGFDYGTSMPTNVYVENIKINSEKGLTTLKLVEQDVGRTPASADKPIWKYNVWEETVNGEANKNRYKITENWYIKDTQGYTYIMPPNFTTNVEITTSAE